MVTACAEDLVPPFAPTLRPGPPRPKTLETGP